MVDMPMVKVGPTHRLAVAVSDSKAARDWFVRVFGAAAVGQSVIPFADDVSSVLTEIREAEGSDSQMIWQGGYPLLFLAPYGEGGYVNQHLARWGPGLHSVAWEIEDMWTADARLREQGLRVSGVNIPGRHFFVHPRDTDGVLVEFTDTSFVDDPRRGGPARDSSSGLIKGATIAWVTAVVEDAAATADLFTQITDAVAVDGNPVRPPEAEQTRDIRAGDITIRFVTPRSASSPYWEALQRGPRLYSYTMRLPDLDAGLRTLEGIGVPVAGRHGDLAWTDPAGTFGVPLEFAA